MLLGKVKGIDLPFLRGKLMRRRRGNHGNRPLRTGARRCFIERSSRQLHAGLGLHSSHADIEPEHLGSIYILNGEPMARRCSSRNRLRRSACCDRSRSINPCRRWHNLPFLFLYGLNQQALQSCAYQPLVEVELCHGCGFAGRFLTGRG